MIGETSAAPAIIQSHECLVKSAVLRRMVREMQLSEVLDSFPIGALAKLRLSGIVGLQRQPVSTLSHLE